MVMITVQGSMPAKELGRWGGDPLENPTLASWRVGVGSVCLGGVPHGKAEQGGPGPRSRERRPSERAKLRQGQGQALKAARVGVNLG